MSITEISAPQYPKISSLLGKYADYPVANAVIEGHSPGRIFVDNAAAPKSAFILTNAGFSYLVGSPENDTFNPALKERLANEIFPKIKRSDDPTLICYPLANGWEAPLKKMLAGLKVHNIFRKQFTFNPDKFAQHADWKNQIPAGFQAVPIDQVGLDKFGADMFPWDSPQAFLEKGFGFWLLKDDELACECSSVFVGGSAVEINIHTEEKYQRQGLATLAASAFIEACRQRGLRPNWECWWDNEPSVALAKKLGFEPVNDHPVFLVELT